MGYLLEFSQMCFVSLRLQGRPKMTSHSQGGGISNFWQTRTSMTEKLDMEKWGGHKISNLSWCKFATKKLCRILASKCKNLLILSHNSSEKHLPSKIKVNIFIRLKKSQRKLFQEKVHTSLLK